MAKKDKRFVTVFREVEIGSNKQIFIDRETGINYLYVAAGYTGGLTPLLDRNGNPVVSSVHEIEECE